jgi:hypothetical protein
MTITTTTITSTTIIATSNSDSMTTITATTIIRIATMATMIGAAAAPTILAGATPLRATTREAGAGKRALPVAQKRRLAAFLCRCAVPLRKKIAPGIHLNLLAQTRTSSYRSMADSRTAVNRRLALREGSSVILAP